MNDFDDEDRTVVDDERAKPWRQMIAERELERLANEERLDVEVRS